MANEYLFRKLVASVPIKKKTLDLVERLMALENSEFIEKMQVTSLRPPGQSTWRDFDLK